MPCASCNKTPEDFQSYSGWKINNELEIGLCPDCYHDYQIGRTIKVHVKEEILELNKKRVEKK